MFTHKSKLSIPLAPFSKLVPTCREGEMSTANFYLHLLNRRNSPLENNVIKLSIKYLSYS